MASVQTLLLVPLLGALIGLALGMLGGASILTVPILVYLLRQDPHIAVAASLVLGNWPGRSPYLVPAIGDPTEIAVFTDVEGRQWKEVLAPTAPNWRSARAICAASASTIVGRQQ